MAAERLLVYRVKTRVIFCARGAIMAAERLFARMWLRDSQFGPTIKRDAHRFFFISPFMTLKKYHLIAENKAYVKKFE